MQINGITLKRISLGILCSLTVVTNVHADIAKGKAAYEQYDFDTAYQEYKLEADKGNTDAMILIGGLYEDGHGVEKSYDKALELYQKAAELGNGAAFNSMGLMYRFSRGVEQDYTKAIKMFEEALNRKNTDALTNLGLMYERGYGVSDNKIVAWALYNQGKTMKNPDAVKLFLSVEMGMSKYDIAKARDLYREMYKSPEDTVSILQMYLDKND